ncbi:MULTISPECIES: CPBP family intramembrane glutamic endopeptidase [Kordiimonas]|jgi:membrane protease YdiL (CAAX protease family)|uniref:CPBP family intramembrane glutamic endopeptidase n=1 Tax=Kordiimonas TaxID=288021 RepID=UPI0025801819|nr:type II CAAX endopeptidase family protein [Kordiimonas sp. UBA4487]
MSDIRQGKTPPTEMTTRTIVLFLVLTAILGGGAAMMVTEMGFKRHYVAIMMWTPGIAALLTYKFLKLDIGSLGWSWGRPKWQLLSFLTPIAYGLVAYGLIWGLGFGGVLDPKFVEEAGYHLGLVGWSPGATVLMGALIFGAVGMIWHMATALGEEIGWRGLLTPLLLRKTSFPIASLLTGLVWAAWHMPLIYFTKYNAGPVDLHVQFANFTLMTVGISFIMTYYWLKSGNLWTATVLHAAHNAYILSILQPMTVQYEETWRYANEFGFILPLVVAVFGLYFWYRAHKEGLAGVQERIEGQE